MIKTVMIMKEIIITRLFLNLNLKFSNKKIPKSTSV
jgi:hypothetical protein